MKTIMWVRCINNGVIRHVTRPINSRYFEDDGKLSGKRPSSSCWWSNYEPLYKYDIEKYKRLQNETN